MATSSSSVWLEAHFSHLTDPRTGNRKVHQLLDIVGLTIIAVICGADDFTAIEAFGQARLDWLRRFLRLPAGVPSHDTIGRCWALIDADEFEQGFRSWVAALVQLLPDEIVAVDGKTVRGSHDVSTGKEAIHMVSAWASSSGICLGQYRVDNKSNEITAIPELLSLLDIQGSIVTIDAMGTQKAIAAQIIDQEAHYVLALKANHSELHSEVVATFDHLAGSSACPFAQDWEMDHGRIESRRCCVLDATDPDFDWILAADLKPWKNLSTIICVEAKRYTATQESFERRYYLSSLPVENYSTQRLNAIVRTHWSVENNLHWSLDVTFGEDASRVRKGVADQNLSVVRRLVLNLLKQDRSIKLGLKNKRLRAGWDQDYLLRLLSTGKV